MVIGKGYVDRCLSLEEIQDLAVSALDQVRPIIDNQRVLVIIPDGTRSAPIPLFFKLFHELLWGRASALDFLVALGTHQPMSEQALNRLVGITEAERQTTYAGVNIFNHRWDLEDTFSILGVIPAGEVKELSGGHLEQDIPVAVNKKALEYDRIIICGPVLPHEVVGFSGGNKYLFPGISGPDMINLSHWLGALLTSYRVIGSGYTPVRALIDRAAGMIPTPKLAFCLVTAPDGLAGLYTGSPEEAWQSAAELSSQVHIIYVKKPFQRVLSVMPEMYDDIWTAAKGMYKLEPVIADGGEVVIYAPNINEISYTHGQLLDRVGYHVRDFFVKQWDRFKDYPLGVLAHSTHLRGMGTYDAETGIESPRIRVTLATGIPPERCRQVNLGYLDPASIDIHDWEGKEDEGILVVPHAGETLYRICK